MRKNKEKGIALILTMILLLVMSVMAISLAFISRTETWSSMNYRLMSQARDAAEAGVNTTSNYLLSGHFSPLPATYYTPPGYSGVPATPFTGYNSAVYPVQSGTNTSGHDVILSALGSVASNYPDSAVQSAFNTSGVGKGSFSAGFTTVNYATSAKLLNMQTLPAFPPFTAVPSTVQTWEITSQGSISGVQAATEQVTAILEGTTMPAFGYAAFANSSGCNALNFGGGGSTDSYDSQAALSGGVPVTTTISGNVGTNGNLATNGNPTVINGTVSTPRTGVGTCSANNVTAWSNSSAHMNCGSGLTDTQCLVELPQPVIYPTPVIPAPGSINFNSNDSNCGSLGATACGVGAAGSPASTYPDGFHLLPGAGSQLGDVRMQGNKDLYISGGTYNINSITEVGSTMLHFENAASCLLLPVAQQPSCVPVDAAHPVILNVTGTGTATPVSLAGGSVFFSGTNFDPTAFEIVYAGTGSIALKGGDNALGVVYAPNADVAFASHNASWYGSVLSGTLSDMGGADIHYDRRLSDKKYLVGPSMLSSFTWNKY